MDIWSVQRCDIVNDLKDGRTYTPDLECSTFSHDIADKDQLYAQLLYWFNQINNTNATGLVFGFLREENGNVLDITSFDDFQHEVRKSKDAIRGLWNSFMLDPHEYCVAHLRYEENFNPLMIDLNDFHAIMPPRVEVEPYSMEDIKRIEELLSRGDIERSIAPSGLMQVHMAEIAPENFMAAYEFFEL